MTKELCEKLAQILNIKIKFYDSEEDYLEDKISNNSNNSNNKNKKNNNNNNNNNNEEED